MDDGPEPKLQRMRWAAAGLQMMRRWLPLLKNQEIIWSALLWQLRAIAWLRDKIFSLVFTQRCRRVFSIVSSTKFELAIDLDQGICMGIRSASARGTIATLLKL